MGPLHVKEERLKKEVSICLVTGVTIRAIHLEIVDDMSPNQFLMELR